MKILSDLVHIDLHWVKPTEELPYNIIITSWMSDLPMNTPEWLEDCRFSELFIVLPKNWDLWKKIWCNLMRK